MFRNTSQRTSRNRSLTKALGRHREVIAGLLSAGLCVSAFAQSERFPTYTVGPQPNGSFVVSNGTIITPAGTQVNLGIRIRAKAVALYPDLRRRIAAVLTMGTSPSDGTGVVEVIDTRTGTIMQRYNSAAGKDSNGSHNGITYTPDGKYLLFSQDDSYVGIAKVDDKGLLSDYAQVSVPIDGTLTKIEGTPFDYKLNTVDCFPNSVPGNDGSYAHYCGHTVSSNAISYPLGIAVAPDGKTAYSVLDINNTLAKIDLTASTPIEGAQVRVGNVPHSVVISADGTTAYVSNEAGRIANVNDVQQYSDGTPVVADQVTGSTKTGTVSVVDLATFKVTHTIFTGLHPTGMAFWGKNLLVTNTYDDTVSVIDTGTNTVVRTIDLGLPIRVPGDKQSAYGAGPNSIAVDANHNLAYVALYNANAIAVVDLSSSGSKAVLGMIPTAYAPSSVMLDEVNAKLIVANDKGIGAKGIAPQNSLRDRSWSDQLQHSPGSRHSKHHPAAQCGSARLLHRSGHPEQSLGSGAKNIRTASGGNANVAPRGAPQKDRRSFADQACVPDHP